MTRIVSMNGEEIGSEIKLRSFQVSLMVQCLCGTPLLLSYIPGMKLATTCRCKRVIALTGLNIDPENPMAVGTAFAIDSSKLLTPTPEELSRLKVV